MEIKKSLLTQIKEVFSSSRYWIPIITILFGFFIWLEWAHIFITWEHTYIYAIVLCIFWLFSLCYLFIKFRRIRLSSKILVLLIALSVSLEFYVLIWYNHIGEEICIPYLLSPKDIFIISSFSIVSILGVLAIVFAILMPRFETELTYLTNLLRVKNRESPRSRRFLEILSSFPVFIGIHYTFFLIFGINHINSCNPLPINYVIIIASPWIILMGFYIIYCFIVGIKSGE